MEHKTIASFIAAQDEFAARHGSLIVGDVDEENFSWAPCGCCRSTLGGTRSSALTLKPRKGARKPPFSVTSWEGQICTDCVLFHANGDLPDHMLTDDEATDASAVQS
jgi:hypothetical protein